MRSDFLRVLAFYLLAVGGAEALAAQGVAVQVANISNQSVQEGTTFTYTATHDLGPYGPSGTCFGSVSYSLAYAPVGMTINSYSGQISWTPTAQQAGQQFTVEVRANAYYSYPGPCYNAQRTSDTAFTITVLPNIVDVDGDGLDDGLEHDLMVLHAPVVALHPDDEYRPSSVEFFLARTQLRYHHQSCSDHQILNRGQVNRFNIDNQSHRTTSFWSLCSHTGTTRFSGTQTPNSSFFLQIPNDSSETTTRRGGSPSDWTCYAHVRRASSNATHFDVQYWFFYPYNGDLVIGSHEGDWEHVTVRVAADGVTVVEVFYTAHTGGEWVPGFAIPRHPPTGQPLVFSALDSHASYARLGRIERFPLPDDQTSLLGPIWDCRDSVVNVGEKFNPMPGGADWLRYSGKWGELGACGSNNGFCNNGPYGPAYQSRWNDDGR